MTSRLAAGLIVLCLAGCANEPIAAPYDPPMSLGAIVVTPQDLAPDTVTSRRRVDSIQTKTVASKVLAAMAFERGTGLKADPARLIDGR